MTVAGYCRRAERAGLTWPLPAALDDAQLEAQLFQRVVDLVGVPRPRPDMAWVHQELKRPGVTLQRLHLEYLAQQPDGYRDSQYCRHYHDWARTLAPTMRQVHRAGEKAFVDFSGKRPVIYDATTGEIQPVELFVGVLGASGYIYAEACPSQELASWITAHKLQVLRQADQCVGVGDLGALIRREGLYASHLTTWRRQREQGALVALAPKKRGRPPASVSPLARRMAELERDNSRLARRLHQAEAILEAQKQRSEILGLSAPMPGEAGNIG